MSHRPRRAHYLRMTNFKASLLLALALAACASDPKPSADGKTCDGTFDIDAATFDGTGPNTVSGVVTLPTSVPAGTLVGIQFNYTTDTYESTSQAFQLAAGGSTISYRITGIAANATDMHVEVYGDANGDGHASDPGDFDGYYGGTATAPVFDDGTAKAVVFAGACTPSINFALGTRPAQ